MNFFRMTDTTDTTIWKPGLNKEFSGNECGCFHALFKNNVFPVNHCSTNSYDFSKNDTEKQD